MKTDSKKTEKKNNVKSGDVEKTKRKHSKKTISSLPSFGRLPLEGLSYQTVLTTKFVNREKYKPKSNNEVYSLIPGTIKKILISPDDVVKKGDVLCILNAMKMDNSICAATDGIIKSINVKIGETINKNTLLINMESLTEDGNKSHDHDEEEQLDLETNVIF